MKKNILLFTLLLVFLNTNLFAITSKQMGVIINLAGKQRMLTQRMSKEALLIKAKIQTDKNINLLSKDMKLFDKTLDGLMQGDNDLELVQVNSPIVQNQLKVVKKLWQPFNQSIQKVINQTANKNDYNYIIKNNIPLLKNMHKAVLLFVDESKKVSKIKSNLAEDINIAGRQRMLTQKMAKDMLQITLNIDKQNATKDLKNTKQLFSKSLKLLQSRKPILKIQKQLLVVEKLWKRVNPYLVPKYAKISKLKPIIATLDKTLYEMNRGVKMYELSAKKQILAKSLSNIVNSLMMQKNLKGLVLNLSGRQRMLTQRISKDTLLVATNVDKKFARKDMIFATKLYTKTLNGFIKGDPSQKLIATKDPKIQEYLKEVKSEWIKFYKNIVSFLKKNDKSALNYIIKNNEKMLKMSHHLVQMYKNSQSSSKISQEMAEKIDLSGRQRMLSQKMLKEKILILHNINASENKKKMQKDISDFDTVLHDLIYGSKRRDWSPEAITHILTQLKVVDGIWKKFKPLLDKNNLTKQELNSINKLDMKLLFEMNKAVQMYQEASDIYNSNLVSARVVI